MIKRKKIEKHIEEQLVEDYALCDICGNKIERVGFDRTDITIDAKVGDNYPEGDFRTGYRLDVCRECFENKVKTLIETTFNIQFTDYNVEDYEGYYVD